RACRARTSSHSLSLTSSTLMYSILFSSPLSLSFFLFFFNDTATTEIYTLSLHDALPISPSLLPSGVGRVRPRVPALFTVQALGRSEEHTSELQSRSDLVCRLLLEKKKKKHTTITTDW